MRLVTITTLLALLVVGCSSTSRNGHVSLTRTPSTGHSVSASASPHSSPTSSPATPAGVIVAVGHGWAGIHLFGATHPAGSCHLRAVTGGLLPDRVCTPGALDAAVTQATIASTICTVGYTATVRPPLPVTAPAKRESAREYGVTGPGEYDHLIPLELGGASDTANMWLEPGPIRNPKDLVENRLHALVCAHKLTLLAAQQLITDDWTTALMLAGGGSL